MQQRIEAAPMIKEQKVERPHCRASRPKFHEQTRKVVNDAFRFSCRPRGKQYQSRLPRLLEDADQWV